MQGKAIQRQIQGQFRNTARTTRASCTPISGSKTAPVRSLCGGHLALMEGLDSVLIETRQRSGECSSVAPNAHTSPGLQRLALGSLARARCRGWGTSIQATGRTQDQATEPGFKRRWPHRSRRRAVACTSRVTAPSACLRTQQLVSVRPIAALWVGAFVRLWSHAFFASKASLGIQESKSLDVVQLHRLPRCHGTLLSKGLDVPQLEPRNGGATLHCTRPASHG